jgi:hypothetical protein
MKTLFLMIGMLSLLSAFVFCMAARKFVSEPQTIKSQDQD